MRFYTIFMIVIFLKSISHSPSFSTNDKKGKEPKFKAIYLTIKSLDLYGQKTLYSIPAISFYNHHIHKNRINVNKINSLHFLSSDESLNHYEGSIYSFNSLKINKFRFIYWLQGLKLGKSNKSISRSSLKYFQSIIKRKCKLFEEIIKTKKAVNLA